MGNEAVPLDSIDKEPSSLATYTQWFVGSHK
jgi:hypothetical protein